MGDQEILVDNENPADDVLSSHGAPTRKTNIYVRKPSEGVNNFKIIRKLSWRLICAP